MLKCTFPSIGVNDIYFCKLDILIYHACVVRDHKHFKQFVQIYIYFKQKRMWCNIFIFIFKNFNHLLISFLNS